MQFGQATGLIQWEYRAVIPELLRSREPSNLKTSIVYERKNAELVHVHCFIDRFKAVL